MPNTKDGRAKNVHWVVLSALVSALDQISKYYVNANFAYAEIREVIPKFFNLTLQYNKGAAFSFLAESGGWQKYLFSALALLVVGFLVSNILRGKFSRLMNLAAALIIGGALGNVIDRWTLGHVVDFLQVYYQNWAWPSFNIADSCICIGVLLMIIDSFKKPVNTKK